MTPPATKTKAAYACALGAMAVFGFVDNLMRIGADTGYASVLENAMIVFATLWAFTLWRAVPDAVVLT